MPAKVKKAKSTGKTRCQACVPLSIDTTIEAHRRESVPKRSTEGRPSLADQWRT